MAHRTIGRALSCVLLALACPSCEVEGLASAQTSPAARPATPSRPGAPASGRTDAFLGEPDAPVLNELTSAVISSARKGKGGRSLAFKVELPSGHRAYFKPEQSFAAHWFSEIASYHLDRELGMGRAAPVVGRRLPWSHFAAATGSDPRLGEVRMQRDGTVRGALTAWIEGDLVPLALPRGWEHWLRIDEPPRVSPFQRAEDWRRARSAIPRTPAPPPDRPDRAAELSDLVLFDYLTGNLDRWGGGSTNVRTRGAGGPLVYLDNANGFQPNVTSTPHLDVQLRAVQRFRRRTIDAISAFDEHAYRQRLARDPLAPLLTEDHFQRLEARRQRLLEHVAATQRTHGAECMPW